MRYTFFSKSPSESGPESKNPTQMIKIQGPVPSIQELKGTLGALIVLDDDAYQVEYDSDSAAAIAELIFRLDTLLEREVNSAVHSFIKKDKKPSSEKYMLEFWLFQAKEISKNSSQLGKSSSPSKSLVDHDSLKKIVESLQSKFCHAPIDQLFNFLEIHSYAPTDNDLEKFIAKAKHPALIAKDEAEVEAQPSKKNNSSEDNPLGENLLGSQSKEVAQPESQQLRDSAIASSSSPSQQSQSSASRNWAAIFCGCLRGKRAPQPMELGKKDSQGYRKLGDGSQKSSSSCCFGGS